MLDRRWTFRIAGLVLATLTGFGWVFAVEPYCAAWGATRAELQGSLPGDELLAAPVLTVNRAITIEAPPDEVWPWLVQLGCHRGGWYSLDWLDNGGTPSAERILPEFQQLKVGDVLPMTLDRKLQIPVVELQRPHWLILGGEPGLEPGATPQARDSGWKSYWTLYLGEAGPGRTRLLSRTRYAYKPDWLVDFAMHHWLVPGSWVMEREMLRGIKRRAERRT